jgi:hypothetical protein
VGVFRYLLNSRSVPVLLFSAFCLVVVPAYIKAPEIAEGLGMKIGSGRKIPYRNDARYFLYPWKMDFKDKINPYGAEQFAVLTLTTVKPPAIIYADGTTAPPLLLIQELKYIHHDKDIKIVSSIGTSKDAPQFSEQTVDKLFSKRNIYVVSNLKGYCPDFLLESRKYKLIPEGILWRVDKRQ